MYPIFNNLSSVSKMNCSTDMETDPTLEQVSDLIDCQTDLIEEGTTISMTTEGNKSLDNNQESFMMNRIISKMNQRTTDSIREEVELEGERDLVISAPAKRICVKNSTLTLSKISSWNNQAKLWFKIIFILSMVGSGCMSNVSTSYRGEETDQTTLKRTSQSILNSTISSTLSPESQETTSSQTVRKLLLMTTSTKRPQMSTVSESNNLRNQTLTPIETNRTGAQNLFNQTLAGYGTSLQGLGTYQPKQSSVNESEDEDNVGKESENMTIDLNNFVSVSEEESNSVTFFTSTPTSMPTQRENLIESNSTNLTDQSATAVPIPQESKISFINSSKNFTDLSTTAVPVISVPKNSTITLTNPTIYPDSLTRFSSESMPTYSSNSFESALTEEEGHWVTRESDTEWRYRNDQDPTVSTVIDQILNEHITETLNADSFKRVRRSVQGDTLVVEDPNEFSENDIVLRNKALKHFMNGKNNNHEAFEALKRRLLNNKLMSTKFPIHVSPGDVKSTYTLWRRYLNAEAANREVDEKVLLRLSSIESLVSLKALLLQDYAKRHGIKVPEFTVMENPHSIVRDKRSPMDHSINFRKVLSNVRFETPYHRNRTFSLTLDLIEINSTTNDSQVKSFRQSRDVFQSHNTYKGETTHRSKRSTLVDLDILKEEFTYYTNSLNKNTTLTLESFEVLYPYWNDTDVDVLVGSGSYMGYSDATYYRNKYCYGPFYTSEVGLEYGVIGPLLEAKGLMRLKVGVGKCSVKFTNDWNTWSVMNTKGSILTMQGPCPPQQYFPSFKETYCLSDCQFLYGRYMCLDQTNTYKNCTNREWAPVDKTYITADTNLFIGKSGYMIPVWAAPAVTSIETEVVEAWFYEQIKKFYIRGTQRNVVYSSSQECGLPLLGYPLKVTEIYSISSLMSVRLPASNLTYLQIVASQGCIVLLERLAFIVPEFNTFSYRHRVHIVRLVHSGGILRGSLSCTGLTTELTIPTSYSLFPDYETGDEDCSYDTTVGKQSMKNVTNLMILMPPVIKCQPIVLINATTVKIAWNDIAVIETSTTVMGVTHKNHYPANCSKSYCYLNSEFLGSYRFCLGVYCTNWVENVNSTCGTYCGDFLNLYFDSFGKSKKLFLSISWVLLCMTCLMTVFITLIVRWCLKLILRMLAKCFRCIRPLFRGGGGTLIAPKSVKKALKMGKLSIIFLFCEMIPTVGCNKTETSIVTNHTDVVTVFLWTLVASVPLGLAIVVALMCKWRVMRHMEDLEEELIYPVPITVNEFSIEQKIDSLDEKIMTSDDHYLITQRNSFVSFLRKMRRDRPKGPVTKFSKAVVMLVFLSIGLPCCAGECEKVGDCSKMTVVCQTSEFDLSGCPILPKTKLKLKEAIAFFELEKKPFELINGKLLKMNDQFHHVMVDVTTQRIRRLPMMSVRGMMEESDNAILADVTGPSLTMFKLLFIVVMFKKMAVAMIFFVLLGDAVAQQSATFTLPMAAGGSSSYTVGGQSYTISVSSRLDTYTLGTGLTYLESTSTLSYQTACSWTPVCSPTTSVSCFVFCGESCSSCAKDYIAEGGVCWSLRAYNCRKYEVKYTQTGNKVMSYTPTFANTATKLTFMGQTWDFAVNSEQTFLSGTMKIRAIGQTVPSVMSSTTIYKYKEKFFIMTSQPPMSGIGSPFFAQDVNGVIYYSLDDLTSTLQLSGTSPNSVPMDNFFKAGSQYFSDLSSRLPQGCVISETGMMITMTGCSTGLMSFEVTTTAPILSKSVIGLVNTLTATTPICTTMDGTTTITVTGTGTEGSVKITPTYCNPSTIFVTGTTFSSAIVCTATSPFTIYVGDKSTHIATKCVATSSPVAAVRTGGVSAVLNSVWDNVNGMGSAVYKAIVVCLVLVVVGLVAFVVTKIVMKCM